MQKHPSPAGRTKNTRPAFYGRPCVLKSYAVLSEKTHLAAFRQVAQSAHLTQTVQNAAADTGSLLQLFHRDIFFAVDGHLFQCIGGSTAKGE